MLDHAPDLESHLRNQLTPGETLEWSERPSPEGLARRVKPMVVFGRLFAGFAAVWMTLATTIIVSGSMMSPSPTPASNGSAPSSPGASTPQSPAPSSSATQAPGPSGASTPATRRSSSSGTPISDAPILFRVGFPLFGLFFLVPGLWIARAGKRAGRAQIIYGLTSRRVIVAEIKPKGERLTRSYEAADLRNLDVREFADGSGDIIFAGVHREGDSSVRVNGRAMANHGLWGVSNVAAVRRHVDVIAAR